MKYIKFYPVLTEANEECVDTHGIHTEETMGNKVGAHDDRLCKHAHSLEHSLCLQFLFLKITFQPGDHEKCSRKS